MMYDQQDVSKLYAVVALHGTWKAMYTTKAIEQ